MTPEQSEERRVIIAMLRESIDDIVRDLRVLSSDYDRLGIERSRIASAVSELLMAAIELERINSNGVGK